MRGVLAHQLADFRLGEAGFVGNLLLLQFFVVGGANLLQARGNGLGKLLANDVFCGACGHGGLLKVN